MGKDTIRVSSDALDSIARSLSHAANKADDASSALAAISLTSANGANRGTNSACSLRVKGSRISGSSVGSALREYENALSWYSNYVGQLSERVLKVKYLFEKCESNITDTLNKDGDTVFEWDKFLLKIVGKAGYAGALISGALSLRDFNAESLIKFAANAANTTAKWYKSNKNLNIFARISKDSADKLRNKKLFGLDRYIKSASRAKSTWTAFRSNFKSKFFESAKKPGTWFVAAIGAGIDNYQEYKTGAITGDRACVEWAVETAGTVALGAAATAATGAALVALGFTAAPVIAVGAVSAVALYGVDALWAKYIDKDKGMIETLGWGIGELYDMGKGALQKVTGAHKTTIEGARSDFKLAPIAIGTKSSGRF